jgi:hypothetical protein
MASVGASVIASVGAGSVAGGSVGCPPQAERIIEATINVTNNNFFIYFFSSLEIMSLIYLNFMEQGNFLGRTSFALLFELALRRSRPAMLENQSI